MLVERLTPTDEAILDALATFRFLTADHMMQLGVTKNKGHLYASLRRLIGTKAKPRKPAVLVKLEYGVMPSYGRLSNLYALTRHGADLLQQAQGVDRNLAIPRQILKAPSDYFHKCSSLDFHVALELWAKDVGATIDFYRSYYEPYQTGSGRFTPTTRIKLQRGYIDADAVFAFTMPDGAQRLCTFEMQRGRKTKYVEDKLATYVQAFEEEAIEHAYDYPYVARVLCVFEDARALALMRERLAINPLFDEYRSMLFAKTLSDLQRNFKDGWSHFDDDLVSLF